MVEILKNIWKLRYKVIVASLLVIGGCSEEFLELTPNNEPGTITEDQYNWFTRQARAWKLTMSLASIRVLAVPARP
jgi:hypothetical protein